MRQITWNEYFMALAMLSSYRSKDPNTKVGACIADDDHKVVSIGYNGMPRSIDDNDLSRDKGKDLNNKYLYVCHAEFNAILNTRNGSALKGCTLYVTLFPCNECAKAIIQTGIKKVVYMDDKYANDITTRASKKMLTLAGVELEQYKEEIKEVLLK
ncbi:MAG: dCMP deaminase family protein [Erysipelotrichaceae bacterium]|jgi:dCMP deaminase|nr:dCMP deaminase family protein [Erysipelotrichaceae bacterium]MCB9500099.1 dCMP deaminase family protein [Erysipelotrichaceae bacterium]